MNRWRLLLAGLVLLSTAATSQAGWRIGIGIGVPIYPGPYCYRPYPYYYGPPVVYAPAPVYVAPAPVVVQPAPAVVQPPPPATLSRSPNETAEPLPAPTPSTAPIPPPPPVARGVAPTSANSDAQGLNNSDPNARADAIIRMGRARDPQAVESVTRALRDDSSPVVREAAARALGLIASPESLRALQYAAQADDDREVRRSAAFAADVIRGNMRR
jgi:hypothetical protein